MSRPQIGDLIPFGGSDLVRTWLGNSVLWGPIQPVGRPGYIQLIDNTKKINLHGTFDDPLIVSMPCGLDLDGSPLNRVVTFIDDKELELPGPGNWYIIARLEDGDDGWEMSFGAVEKTRYGYFFGETESYDNGSIQYDLEANRLKLRVDGSWTTPEPFAVIGSCAVGANNIVYSSQSFIGRYTLAENFLERVTYDGMSAITNGELSALMPVTDWYRNWDIVYQVLTTPAACTAVLLGPSGRTVLDEHKYSKEFKGDAELLMQIHRNFPEGPHPLCELNNLLIEAETAHAMTNHPQLEYTFHGDVSVSSANKLLGDPDLKDSLFLLSGYTYYKNLSYGEDNEVRVISRSGSTKPGEYKKFAREQGDRYSWYLDPNKEFNKDKHNSDYCHLVASNSTLEATGSETSEIHIYLASVKWK